MRHLYAVECPLSVSPLTEDVARLWHEWILERKPTPKLPKELAASPAMDLSSTEIEAGQVLEQIRVDADGAQHLALRWTHPDNKSRGVQWRTELCYRSVRGDDPPRFSCKLAVGRTTDRIAPTRRVTTRPKIVARMLERFPGIDGELLKTTPSLLRLADVKRFVRFLTSRDRKRPVVLISCRNVDDRPCGDPEEISSLLAGLAFVYVSEGRWPSLALRDHLPRSLGCRDGDVRIYWPGLSIEREDGHPYWTTADQRYLAEQEKGLRQVLLERIVEAAVYTAGAHQADWHRFESMRRQAQIETSRAAGDFESLAVSYAAENDSLRQQIDLLEEQLGVASDGLRQALNDVKYWRTQYEDARGKGTAAEEELEVTSVADALDRAVTQSSGRLVESLNSASDRDTPFSAPEEVFDALRFLATTYYESKTGQTPCANLNRALKERLGWSYNANQSASTVGKYRSQYECKWEGRTYRLEAHVGDGSSKDPRYTIRVAFAWDEERKVVVIGFVGQHQETDKT